MMKTMMTASGLPPSLSKYVLKMAVYVRNRTYHQAIKNVPYRLMKSKKPNLHQIKKIGSIAYVYKSTGPAWRKRDDLCVLGFIVGLLEGQAGDGNTASVVNWMTAVEGDNNISQDSEDAVNKEQNDSADMEVADDLPPASDNSNSDLPDYEDLEEIFPAKTPWRMNLLITTSVESEREPETLLVAEENKSEEATTEDIVEEKEQDTSDVNDVEELEEPEEESEPVHSPSDEALEPTSVNESGGEGPSPDTGTDCTRRPPWNTLDIVDAYMIGQLPSQVSAANGPTTVDAERSGQEIVSVDAGDGMDVSMASRPYLAAAGSRTGRRARVKAATRYGRTVT
ncbi:hypothetical protein L915_13809 [Phytophthora nicotianae]|uniref:Uncharacterized protein n=1 Tax=Phytophthora nicotianae TaxID=4792 RepID=W2GE66_PHYNI|nr:hypothetical protein L915_13809 [Phytophthora nicotianae]